MNRSGDGKVCAVGFMLDLTFPHPPPNPSLCFPSVAISLYADWDGGEQFDIGGKAVIGGLEVEPDTPEKGAAKTKKRKRKK